MSPLTRQMWLDAWTHLTSARQSFGEARTTAAKERALVDCIALADSFKASCLSLAVAINYEKQIREGDE